MSSNSTRDSQRFADCQPRWAAHRVPTFPIKVTVDGKKPMVKGWNKTSLSRSALLAEKFPDAESLGITSGRLSGLTIVDVDSNDLAALQEAERMFGASRLVWRTSSGNYAMAFRHNGERRRIRPIRGLPLDLLGEGGYAAAPPSKGVMGRYEIIRGSLSDLENLPTAIIPDAMLQNTTSTCVPNGKFVQGERHNALGKELMRQIWHCDNWESFLDCARGIGTMQCDPPMDDLEIANFAKWFWEMKERGFLVRPKHRHWQEDVTDLIYEGAHDAALLMQALRVEHPGERMQFVIANAYHERMNMGETRLAKARELLHARGHLRLIKKRTWDKPALYGWP